MNNGLSDRFPDASREGSGQATSEARALLIPGILATFNSFTPIGVAVCPTNLFSGASSIGCRYCRVPPMHGHSRRRCATIRLPCISGSLAADVSSDRMALHYPSDRPQPKRENPSLGLEPMISGLLMGFAALGFAACSLLVISDKGREFLKVWRDTGRKLPASAPSVQNLLPGEGIRPSEIGTQVSVSVAPNLAAQ